MTTQTNNTNHRIEKYGFRGPYIKNEVNIGSTTYIAEVDGIKYVVERGYSSDPGSVIADQVTLQKIENGSQVLRASTNSAYLLYQGKEPFKDGFKPNPGDKELVYPNPFGMGVERSYRGKLRDAGIEQEVLLLDKEFESVFGPIDQEIRAFYDGEYRSKNPHLG
ncbi:MAG TPA: hypothetical protein VJH92_01485 [Candidatus Nanoarchaeia archaeon]|nr:hypothetical protein [Candidatus Nanoarchaeia archaeon]